MPFAYIDPASGSMLLQLVIAGVVAVPFFFRRAITESWRRIRGERVKASSPGSKREE